MTLVGPLCIGYMSTSHIGRFTTLGYPDETKG
jgi:hypothetical protein